MKKLLIAALFLGLMQNAHADIIDNETYLTDEDSGLDWLDVTATIGQSYDEVSAQLGRGGKYEGWKYATSAQLKQLVTNFYDDQPPYMTDKSDILLELISMIGNTYLKSNFDNTAPEYDHSYEKLRKDTVTGFTSGMLLDDPFSFSVTHRGFSHRVALIRVDFPVDITSDKRWHDLQYRVGPQGREEKIAHRGSFLVRKTGVGTAPSQSTSNASAIKEANWDDVNIKEGSYYSKPGPRYANCSPCYKTHVETVVKDCSYRMWLSEYGTMHGYVSTEKGWVLKSEKRTWWFFNKQPRNTFSCR